MVYVRIALEEGGFRNQAQIGHSCQRGISCVGQGVLALILGTIHCPYLRLISLAKTRNQVPIEIVTE